MHNPPPASHRSFLPLASALLLAIACAADPVSALFEVPELEQKLEGGFYSLPYPNDIRIKADGLIDMSDVPRPNALLEDYIDAIAQDQKGFGLSSALYFRFEGAISDGSLPKDPASSLEESASVYLVNIDKDSSTYGDRIPLEFRFQHEAGESIGPFWLGCLPFPGFVMAEDTTYALVATKRLHSADGGDVLASADFKKVISASAPQDARLARAHQIYESLGAYLDEPGGDDRGDVVNAAVFTTQNVTHLMGRFRDVIYRDVPAPTPRDIMSRTASNEMVLYTGRYDSPNFQAGEYPYQSLANGGDFELDPATGDPILQGSFDLRFSMSLPTGETPPNGWPVVLYAHGTGGTYRSYESNGTAIRFARLGIAVVSIDQVMHGDRLPNGDPTTTFFNFLNPLAGRGNAVQASLEGFQLLRLVEGFDFVDVEANSRVIRFDSDKIAFFGHSQGSLTGVPFVAMEPKIKGAVFSGAGGLLYLTMLHKTLPFDVPSILALIIRDTPLDRFHPALALMQAFFEPADSVTYGRLLVQEPAEGNLAKHILQTQGITDRFTPFPNIEALATAIGLNLVAPQEKSVAGLELLGKEVLSAPAAGNAGEVTAVLTQYNEAQNSDGHFVVFDLVVAKLQSTVFIKTLFDTGRATLVAP